MSAQEQGNETEARDESKNKRPRKGLGLGVEGLETGLERALEELTWKGLKSSGRSQEVDIGQVPSDPASEQQGRRLWDSVLYSAFSWILLHPMSQF